MTDLFHLAARLLAFAALVLTYLVLLALVEDFEVLSRATGHYNFSVHSTTVVQSNLLSVLVLACALGCHVCVLVPVPPRRWHSARNFVFGN